MASPDPNRPAESPDNQVWKAIGVFEQIVQQIPNDRVSLEALSHAYEEIGDLTRAREYLVRLAGVVTEEQDRDTAKLLMARLDRHAADDPAAREALARLAAMIERPAAAAPAAAPTPETAVRASTVAAELSFAWDLFQAGELTQEEYAAVAQDLTELSANDRTLTVSVLHVLHDRGSRNLERIVSYAARDSGTPMIPLDAFDVQESAYSLLPLDVMVRQGAIPYESVGTELLVAILNPYNRQLRKDLDARTGRRCHVYVAMPAAFDAALETIRQRLAAKAEASGEGRARVNP
jgi:hypothetical protein